NTASCDDHNACTLGDRCSGGSCVPGAERDCNDNNVCTDDSCNTTTGECEYTNNTASCDDLNPCTLDDTCADGTCVGTPKVCDDGVFCNGFETCDGTTGDCVNGTPPTCDDGIVCTSNVCDPTTDMCVNAGIPGCCSSNADCNNGNVCDGVETCDTSTG